MIDCAMFFMEEYVQDHLDHIHKESFTQEMIEQVAELLSIQFECQSLTPEIRKSFWPTVRRMVHNSTLIINS